MTPELLRILQAVVEQGGFGRAATAVHLTQSAVSQAIGRLEAAAGGPVVTRARPPRPTALGARLLRHARETAAREALLRRDLDDLRRGGGGLLVVGASQALTREALPALLLDLLSKRPLTSLHVEVHPSRELIRHVAEGRLELGLGPFQKSMAGLTTQALGTQRMVLHAARGGAVHRAVRKRGAAALGEIALVTSHLDAPASRRGGGQLRDRFRTVWEVHSLDLRIELVRAGVAVGYLPQSTVALSRWRRSLAPLDALEFGAIDRRYGFFHRDDRELSPAALALLALARASR